MGQSFFNSLHIVLSQIYRFFMLEIMFFILEIPNLNLLVIIHQVKMLTM